MMHQQFKTSEAQREAMMMNVNKPNPYVIVSQEERDSGKKNFSFKYPKSKIFVGGLDFKLS